MQAGERIFCGARATCTLKSSVLSSLHGRTDTSVDTSPAGSTAGLVCPVSIARTEPVPVVRQSRFGACRRSGIGRPPRTDISAARTSVVAPTTVSQVAVSV